MHLIYKRKCFFCGHVDESSILNENTIYCQYCNRNDVDFEVRFIDDGVDDFDIQTEIRKMETRPRQKYPVGDYFYTRCNSCGFKGILYKGQLVCPICVKKDLTKHREVNMDFGLILKIWGEVLKYLKSISKEQLLEDIHNGKIIYQTREGDPPPPESKFINVLIPIDEVDPIIEEL